MERSDDLLLDLALQGDSACFGELAQRWERPIYRFICRYVNNGEEAKDLTQDTFAKAFQNLGRLSDTSRFSSWLYTIALNECRMRFRRRGNVRDVALEDAAWEAPAPAHQSPEHALAAKERRWALREAFAELPDEQRDVIVLKEYQGMKFREIAEILDIPISTVKSRMYLGLKTLRKLMEGRL